MPAFDTLKVAERLENEGTFSKTQAESIALAIHGFINESAVSKDDLAEFAARVENDLQAKLDFSFGNLKWQIIIWISILFAAFETIEYIATNVF